MLKISGNMLIKELSLNRVNTPNVANNNAQRGFSLQTKPYANDSFTKTVAFKGNESPDKDVFDAVLKQEELNYLESGNNCQEILLDSKNGVERDSAARKLVEEGHFQQIADYLSTINEPLSKKDSSTIFDITAELLNQRQKRPIVNDFIELIFKENYANDSIKTLMKNIIKALQQGI